MDPGTIEVVTKIHLKGRFDYKIHLIIKDRMINNHTDVSLVTIVGNLYTQKLIFDINPRITYKPMNQAFDYVSSTF